MNRDQMLAALDDTGLWDLIVVGGGATGLGIAVESASRGYRTLLLEQHDFAKGTSSRSTKLVHGGVRYLAQGNVSLVREALRERGRLLHNAPHLVHEMAFVVPNYRRWDQAFFGVGLKVYDLLSGRESFGASRFLPKQRVIELLPTIEPRKLVGGVLYHDGQFDDARLAISLALTAADQQAVLLNYMPVFGLVKADGRVQGVQARDEESGREYELRGKVVINATGVFVDQLRTFDEPGKKPLVAPSQGAHLVLDRSFLPGNTALMVPRTEDGRVLFCIPWLDSVVVGTTDIPVEKIALEPRPMEEEIDFLLRHAAKYLTRDPQPSDIRSVFAGLRPLVAAGDESGSTAQLSRDHTLLVSNSGLVTITGGKWTTYRKMAEEAVNRAAEVAGLPQHTSVTISMPLHGACQDAHRYGDLREYGLDAPAIRQLMQDDPRYAEKLHPEHPTTAAEVVWAARQEMARTVEDVLARRTRNLILDARASIDVAPQVAALLAAELGRDDAWQQAQVQQFRELAQRYLWP